MSHQILVINPGSTSTKSACFEDERTLWSHVDPIPADQIRSYKTILDQLDFRLEELRRTLQSQSLDAKKLSAVMSRGGPFKPLAGGIYAVGPELLEDIRQGRVQAEHASNLGVFLADDIARVSGAPAYFMDPVSVDEFEPVARISGIPEIERKSLVHALNVKAAAREAAARLGRSVESLNFVVAHLGGGISVCALRNGRIVDVNNANEEGPFSPERSGSLPVGELVKICFSGRFTYEEMKKKIVGGGGLTAYLDTNDAREVEARIDSEDKKARLIFEAMAYQIAKEIGAMAAVLSGRIDAVVITGGLARSERLTGWIRDRVSFLAPFIVIPGEREMEALASGALRALRGEEEVMLYA
jgi:butyrate kinase